TSPAPLVHVADLSTQGSDRALYDHEATPRLRLGVVEPLRERIVARLDNLDRRAVLGTDLLEIDAVVSTHLVENDTPFGGGRLLPAGHRGPPVYTRVSRPQEGFAEGRTTISVCGIVAFNHAARGPAEVGSGVAVAAGGTQENGDDPRPIPTPDRHRVADLRDRRPGLRVRHLRAPDAAAHRGARAPRADRREAGLSRVQPMGGLALLAARDRGRNLRAPRRLPDRPVRPPARARLEHPPLRALGAGLRLCDLCRVAPLLPVHDLRGRMR